jgi:hypothetical protein
MFTEALMPAHIVMMQRQLTSRNTALAHCIGEVETRVCKMKGARSTVFGVI